MCSVPRPLPPRHQQTYFIPSEGLFGYFPIIVDELMKGDVKVFLTFFFLYLFSCATPSTSLTPGRPRDLPPTPSISRDLPPCSAPGHQRDLTHLTPSRDLTRPPTGTGHRCTSPIPVRAPASSPLSQSSITSSSPSRRWSTSAWHRSTLTSTSGRRRRRTWPCPSSFLSCTRMRTRVLPRPAHGHVCGVSQPHAAHTFDPYSL